MAFSVSRMESIRSWRCALRKSWRDCASWNSSMAAALTGPRASMRLRTSLQACSASPLGSGAGAGGAAGRAFHGGGVDRAESFDAVAPLIAGPLGPRDGIGVGHRVVGRAGLQ